MESRFPYPPYANGWFRVAYSDEIAPGEVKPLHYLGRELVLWREEGGAPHVFDAFCPHLGAHLGHGGAVDGASIRCPFHAWRFDGDGSCVEVPYASRIPDGARVARWPVVERNGVVFIWHHDRRGPPTFDVPDLPEIGHPEWTPLEVRRWTVRSRWLDMNENAVDQVHFRYVHGTRSIPQTEVEIDGHILRCRSRMKLATPRGEVGGGLDTTDYGPAIQTVHLHGIVPTLMLNTTVPIDEETTDVSFAYTVSMQQGAETARGVGAAIIRDLEKQFDQDRPIWENKRYWESPLLVPEDGKFGIYRRWWRQFFSAEDAGQTPA